MRKKYRVYTTDGSEIVATSVIPVKNNAGTGFRVDAEIDGHKAVIFYKADEIETIKEIV